MVNVFLKIALSLLLASAVMSDPSMEGCIGYQGGQYCTACDTSKFYYLIGNGCVRYSGNACTSIDYQGNCINCQQGFYLAYGNTCTLVNFIVGCTEYATDTAVTVCRKCAPTYILERNRCLESVPNCLQYIVGTNICAQCALGYTQAPDWCSCVLGTIQNCVQYDCLGSCVLCNANFPRLSAQRNLCLNQIPYCQVYSPNANGCRTCYPGYVLSSDSLECFPGIRWCTDHSQTPSGQTVTCNTCQTDYFLSSDRRSCNAQIPNCQNINTSALTCSLCNAGYVTTDDNKACLPIIANCIVYQHSNHLTDAHKCSQCSSGYTPSSSATRCGLLCPNNFFACQFNNTCVEIPECCEFHDGCGRCTSLKAGWLWCDQHCCVKIPTDCTNYDPCGNCICPSGQSWCKEKKQCISAPECCATHDGCGNCKTVLPGWSFCVAQNRCVRNPTNCAENDGCGNCKCGNGFTVCPSTQACAAEPVCCIGASDLCGGCARGSNRPGQVYCASTKQCRQVNADCPDNDDGCGNCVCGFGQDWCSRLRRCVNRVNCPFGSSYDGCGSCTCNNSNQSYCASSNSCVTILSCYVTPFDCANPQVRSGFAICQSTGQCYQIPNCPGGREVCGTCQCQAGQVFCARLNQCVTTPSCCTSDDGCGACLTTRAGTVFLNGQCFNQVNIPFCTQYTANLQQCTVCQAGYQLRPDGGACLLNILKCQTYAVVGGVNRCSVCENPYLVNSDGSLCVIPRCQNEARTSTTITCNQCQGQLILNNERTICAERIQFCVEYTISFFSGQVFTACNACSLPYFADRGSCKIFGFRILGWSAGGNYALGGGSSFWVANANSLSLQWASYSSSFTSSSFLFVFELSVIENTTDRFSIRLFKEVAPGVNVPYSITTTGNMISLETYRPNGNVAEDSQQWTCTFDYRDKSYTIQAKTNNQYLGTGMNLVSAPFKFFFDKVTN